MVKERDDVLRWYLAQSKLNRQAAAERHLDRQALPSLLPVRSRPSVTAVVTRVSCTLSSHAICHQGGPRTGYVASDQQNSRHPKADPVRSGRTHADSQCPGRWPHETLRSG